MSTCIEVVVDSRGRVSLGRAGMEPGRYRLVVSDTGNAATLTRVVSVPLIDENEGMNR